MVIFPVITIDGPSGVGKSSLCNEIARTLKWNILNSGIIYRVLVLLALYHKIDLTSEASLVILTKYLDVYSSSNGGGILAFLNRQVVRNKIFTQEIANAASKIAVFPKVREILLSYQRSFCKAPGLIADGRDMGTVVFPDAQVKIFLDALPEKRAYRRMIQLQKSGFYVKFEDILHEIKKRDYKDTKRMIAPLVPAKDALFLDSSNLSIEQVIKEALQYVFKRINIKIY